MMDKKRLIDALNVALAQEHACHIRYLTHATVIAGPYAETVSSRLQQIGQDEGEHAQKLRYQIDYLDGYPTMEVAKEDLTPAESLEDILKVNIDEEHKAIAMYRSLLNMIDEKEMTWLYETIEDIIEDEEEHLYQIQTLLGG